MARRRKRRVFFTGDPTGMQPGDDVGNRYKKQAKQIPPDDIGNRKKDDPEDKIPADDIGNRVDLNPTHELSGILWDTDAKKGQKRRRLKVGGPQVRLGRYVVGGVNPAVAGDSQRAQEAQEAHDARRREDSRRARAEAAPPPSNGAPVPAVAQAFPDDDERRGRKRKKKGRGTYEQVDGEAASQVNQRRAARFFDFDEDDRFQYTLKTSAEEKRLASEECVQRILDEALREAKVKALLIEDGERPKVLVTIDDRGPSADVPSEVQSENAEEPLFPMGSAALMSLNYLVNKIVNRYPDDRIRLAILPADEAQGYLDALEEHKKTRKDAPAPAKKGRPAPTPAALVEELAPAAEEVEAASAEVEEEPSEEPEVEAADEDEEEVPVKKAAKKATRAKKAEVDVEDEEDEDEAPARAAKKTTKKVAAKKATTTKKAAATKKVAKAPAKKATATKKTAKAPAKKATKAAGTKKASKKAG